MMLLDSLEEERFENGEDVIQQGDEGDGMYIIVDGSVGVTQALPTGQVITVKDQLGAGAYFGEIALINNSARIATVTATSALTCMKLARHTFDKLLGPIHDILGREMQRREKEVERAKRDPIKFEDLQIMNILGVGTFGRVKMAIHRLTGKPYALKCMRKGQVIGLKQARPPARPPPLPADGGYITWPRAPRRPRLLLRHADRVVPCTSPLSARVDVLTGRGRRLSMC